MAGTVNVSRDLWDDPTFKDSEMSQREAWIWMIADAAWKAHDRRFGAYEIFLKRGQLAASTRFMAKAWGWTESRVRRYLKVLENRRMVCLAIDAGVTVVTICKYDTYQNGSPSTDAATTQHPTQDRRTTDAKEKKGRREEGLEERDTNVSLVVLPDLKSAVSRFNDAAEKAGWPKVQKLTEARSKHLRKRIQEAGGSDGWEVALRKAYESDFLNGRTAKPFTGFSFDWLVNVSNFTKIMEGNYDNRDRQTGYDQHGSRRTGNNFFDALSEVAAERSGRG